MQPNDVRDVYRVPNKNEPAKSTVVAEFSNTLTKALFLNSARKYNKNNQLKAEDLGIENNSSILYISESLTPKSRRLHFLARDFATAENYKYCWTTNGNVYLKKEKGSPYILIKNEMQFNKLKVSE